MKNWKTTTTGILLILGALINAGLEYLKTSTCNFPVLFTGLTAGWGLIKAKDAGVVGPAICLLLIPCLFLTTSCETVSTTTTYPDGRIVTVKSNAPDAASMVAGANLAGTVLPYLVDRHSGK